MLIKLLENCDFETFKDISNSMGYIFNSEKWLKIYDNISLYGIYDNQQKLVGGFHIYNGKQYSLKHLNNPPYAPHIGLFFENKSQNKSNFQSYTKSIIELVAEFIDTLPSKIITLAIPPIFKDMQPFIWKNFKVIPNYTYQINLNQLSLEDIQNNFSPERRNDIKKAIKDGVETKLNHDNEIVKKLILKTFSRKEKAVNDELLNKILFEFADETNSFSFVSYKNNLPSAAAFCIYTKQRAYYLLGGYDNANKHQGAGASAVWECMKHAKNLGVEYFDFEGSMIPAVEKYFRGFGGDLVTYFTINKAPMPIEIALKFIKRSIF